MAIKTKRKSKQSVTSDIPSLSDDLVITSTRGGTNSSIFLKIWETLYPQVFLGVVLCIKNLIIFKKNFKNELLHPLPGV